MSQYFNSTEVCPNSRDLLLHSTVTTVCCGRCGLFNPNFSDPVSTELPKRSLVERARSKPAANQEIVEINEESSSPAPEIISATLVPPPKRRGKSVATQIPTLPNFKLGYVEKERQSANDCIAGRKPSTGFTSSEDPIVHFNVGVAHFNYDSSSDKGSY